MAKFIRFLSLLLQVINLWFRLLFIFELLLLRRIQMSNILLFLWALHFLLMKRGLFGSLIICRQLFQLFLRIIRWWALILYLKSALESSCNHYHSLIQKINFILGHLLDHFSCFIALYLLEEFSINLVNPSLKRFALHTCNVILAL